LELRNVEARCVNASQPISLVTIKGASKRTRHGDAVTSDMREAHSKIVGLALSGTEGKADVGHATNIPGQKVLQGSYSAFVPAPLAPDLNWTPRLIGALSDADRLVGRLAGEGGRLPNPHILIRPFVQRK
jgi:hypothetical protein